MLDQLKTRVFTKLSALAKDPDRVQMESYLGQQPHHGNWLRRNGRRMSERNIATVMELLNSTKDGPECLARIGEIRQDFLADASSELYFSGRSVRCCCRSPQTPWHQNDRSTDRQIEKVKILWSLSGPVVRYF
ncbi:hypothetical protein VTL71DRAFT_16228 [Oculimacula yallundae]|uniref:Uncharacterized protein n=1 Tax=Oculimacula yallundae TaxID=86028 RepID=A0ABR4CDW5_9HELO